MSVTDVYDIREIIQVLQDHGIDDEDTLTQALGNNTNSTSTLSSGGTILSSAQTAAIQTADVSSSAGNENEGISDQSSPLSVNPSMIDSSLTSFLSSLSNTIPSHDSISSVSSQSTPRHSPDSFANIGRFLSANNEDCDGISVLSLMTSVEEGGGEQRNESGVKWWEQVEDWDSFTADANNYLKLLILEEINSGCAGKSANNDADACNINSSGEVIKSSPGFFKLWHWFKDLYETITNARNASDNEMKFDSERANFVSSLIKQIVAIKHELDEMPPEPPSLPTDLTLDEVSDHIREKLLLHYDRVNAWKAESMQRREKLETKYAACQEKLLACIIDTEEEMFWKKGQKQRHDKWSSVNDDGYVEIVSKNIPTKIDGVCQSKSALSQYATIIAATIGAGLCVVVTSVLARRKGGC